MIVRTVRESDAGAIVALLNPIIRSGRFTSIEREITVDEQLDFIRTLPERASYLAAIGAHDTLVGIQDILPGADGSTGDVSTFVALEAARGGIGAALMRASLEVARRLGYERLRAVIRADNPGAVAFYRAQGFAAAGTHDERLVYELSVGSR